MGKHRKKNHYRRITVAVVAIGAVGVPSVAVACNQWPDGSGGDARSHSAANANNTYFQQRWTEADWQRWARNWDRQPSSAASKTPTTSPSTAKPSAPQTSAPKASAPKATVTTSPSTPKTTAPKAGTTTAPSTPSAPETSAPKSTATASPSTPATTASASGELARIVELVNDERSKAGCSPVTLNATLSKAAQAHSEDMASHQNMSHTGSDGSNPGDRITRAGYSWSTYGENVAYGYSTPEQVMAGWMASPGHKANILNCSFKEIGVGLAQPNDYWTQDFGTAR
ncbi:cysteine-rich secretory protein family protein [Streptomyces jeddahensis]|uniref:Cysteine-rich secretory protein family protein n=1 Tax=Streptomyces jeddahensis TaxID=1716141 RepID=A0A177HVM5_9ACTN|nr:CAP domain-containing protein [Streptomyces jeddahensis]OAH14992.1 cysteine-rich secretory protein family protein [Streptomyces jeddahensis]